MPATVAEAPKGASKNGTAVAVPPERRMPRSEVTVDVGPFEWEGVEWSAVMRSRVASWKVDAMWGAVSIAEYKQALSDLVVSWDFVDEDGKPLPIPARGGMRECPYGLLLALGRAYQDALAAPKG